MAIHILTDAATLRYFLLSKEVAVPERYNSLDPTMERETWAMNCWNTLSRPPSLPSERERGSKETRKYDTTEQ